jgi:hypothetical protein
MTIMPVSHSTASGAKKRNFRRVSTDVSPVPKGRGTLGSSNIRPDLSQMLDSLNNSNRALFRRSLREVLQDRDDVLERLAAARQANDTRSEALYESLHKKLV